MFLSYYVCLSRCCDNRSVVVRSASCGQYRSALDTSDTDLATSSIMQETHRSGDYPFFYYPECNQVNMDLSEVSLFTLIF